ncbi:MAG: hypothetical protein WAU00_01400, partial [Caldilinea sp.]
LVHADATPETFAEAVDALLNTPAQQASVSEAARRHLQEQYDWRLLGERLHEFYEEVLRRDRVS